MKNKKKVLLLVFSLICLSLAVFDIFDKVERIEADTLGLLVLAALPLLADYVGSIKAGGMEVTFKDLTKSEQLFLLLETFARKRMWTFYHAREGETDLGQGLRVFVEDLINSNRKGLSAKLQEWLDCDDNPNLRYFAAEIIGYFRIQEFRGGLKSYYAKVNDDCIWEDWQLNCLWAHSRLNNYDELNRLLMSTMIPKNQLWILESYRQMIKAGEDSNNELKTLLNIFMERESLNDQVRAKIKEVLTIYSDKASLAAMT